MSRIHVAQVVGRMVGGGVESVVLNYCRLLDPERYRMDFLVSEDSTCVPHRAIRDMGGQVVFLPRHENAGRYARSLQWALGSQRYDIVHAHLNALSVIPLFVASQREVKIRIAHSHSTSTPREPLRNLVKHSLRPLSKTWATHLMACSRHAGDWLFGSIAPYFVLPNAIQLDRFAFREDVRRCTRRTLGLEDEFVVGHVGRFCTQKNHTYLIDVFRQVLDVEPNSHLLLVGDGPLRAEVEALVVRHGLSGKVSLVGLAERPQDYYSAMDVLCLPSLYEGLSVVTVEAQAAGLPCVVSSAVPSEADWTGDVVWLSLDAAPRCWADELLRSARQPRKAVQLSSSPFDISACAPVLAEYYEEAMRSVS